MQGWYHVLVSTFEKIMLNLEPYCNSAQDKKLLTSNYTCIDAEGSLEVPGDCNAGF